VKFRPVAAIVLAAIALFLAACDAKTDVAENSSKNDAVAVRVITLAPNLAELMFAANAGDNLVGVSAHTDYPDAARELPIIGDAFLVDQEQLALLKPDLLLAWDSGTPVHVIDQLQAAGYRVEVIHTQSLADVATALETIGELTGNSAAAAAAASTYRADMQTLVDRYADRESISVFYQISNRPLYTVNGDHYISELLKLCGGSNVFADIGGLAPMIDVEAVVSRNPEVMLAGEDGRQSAFEVWDRWPTMTANRYGNRFFMPSAEIGRATPRLVRAGYAVCEALVEARRNRRDFLAAT